MNVYPKAVSEFCSKNWSKFGVTNWQTDSFERNGNTLEGGGISFSYPFPMEATSDQNYKEEEFKAYRELGRWLAIHAWTNPPSFGLPMSASIPQ
jgi:hypothetical protein